MGTFAAGLLLGAVASAGAGLFVGRAQLRRTTRAEAFTVKVPAVREALRDVDTTPPIRDALNGLYYSAALSGRSDVQLVDGMLQSLIDLESAQLMFQEAEDRLGRESVEYLDEKRDWGQTRLRLRRQLMDANDEYNAWLRDRFVGKLRSFMPRSVWRLLWQREQQRIVQRA